MVVVLGITIKECLLLIQIHHHPGSKLVQLLGDLTMCDTLNLQVARYHNSLPA